MNASIDDGSSSPARSTRRGISNATSLRDIFRPMLSGVECDHANRGAVLPRHQIGDDGFEICLLDVGLGKRGAKVSEIIDDKINGLIVIGWHNRRDPISAHEKTPNAITSGI
jgi:hypothetical protein